MTSIADPATLECQVCILTLPLGWHSNSHWPVLSFPSASGSPPGVQYSISLTLSGSSVAAVLCGLDPLPTLHSLPLVPAWASCRPKPEAFFDPQSRWGPLVPICSLVPACGTLQLHTITLMDTGPCALFMQYLALNTVLRQWMLSNHLLWHLMKRQWLKCCKGNSWQYSPSSRSLQTSSSDEEERDKKIVQEARVRMQS